MSICRCSSYRALSRSRFPPSKALASFLYQTPTLQQQQWNTAAHYQESPIARRKTQLKSPPPQSRYEHDVPFEDETQPPPTREEAEGNRGKTTITGSERAAFENLYKKFKAPERETGGKKTGPPELDQIADEWWEDDEDPKVNDKSAKGADLDSLFDAVLSGKVPNTTGGSRNALKKKSKRKVDLATLAQDIMQPEQDETKRRLRHVATQRAAKLKIVQNEENQRIKGLLEAAQTDRELWQVLEKEVFGVIEVLNLDKDAADAGKGKKSSKQLSTPAKPNARRFSLPNDPASNPSSMSIRSPSPQDPRVLFHNYPHHLITACSILQHNFPSSPLPFSILPTLKSHGRSSYALGATTALYKLLIRAAWYQRSDYTEVCALLQDMVNGGIEYDSGTLNLIDEILFEWRTARSGRLGKGAQVVLRMELFTEGINRLKAWREDVAKRLGVWSEKRAQEGGLVRRVGSERENVKGRGNAFQGPRDEVIVRGMEDMDGKRDVPRVGGVSEEALAGSDGEGDALSGLFEERKREDT
ncbi:hypothetical protein CC80DRAFT_486831 [Byssothecium circinans]|uniref:Mtf2-like C-terminal domain-containing protein n=1 Tax=Byssothecium circinans TaxID=147558 RepID=A0A6A5UEV0_9PLEO|nr:hypothetical protein CC80DRAFT_486831 [Byssothecium circinans]